MMNSRRVERILNILLPRGLSSHNQYEMDDYLSRIVLGAQNQVRLAALTLT